MNKPKVEKSGKSKELNGYLKIPKKVILFMKIV